MIKGLEHLQRWRELGLVSPDWRKDVEVLDRWSKKERAKLFLVRPGNRTKAIGQN